MVLNDLERVSLPPGLWVVIAAFNEADTIQSVLEEVLRVAPKVVVVDDGSTDDTATRVLRTNAWLITHPVNLGQGAALQTGLSFALQHGASHVVTFDADGQHRVDDIAPLVQALEREGADFALGSRFLGDADGIPWSRKMLLRGAVLFTHMLSGIRLSDTHNGLRAMTDRAARHLTLTFNRMEHASELIEQIARSGLRYVEVPVCIRYTAGSLRKGQRTTAAIGLGIRLLLNKLTT